MKKGKKLNLKAIIAVLFIAGFSLSMVSNHSAYQDKTERKLPSFSALNLALSADVILSQGATQKVEIQASEKLQKLIETEVKDGELKIKWADRFFNNTYGEKVKIYITMVDINALRISGSGDIIADGSIKTSNIQLSISGSGKISLNELASANINASISGSASITIGGSSPAQKLAVGISGSGDFIASDLPVKDVEVSVSGSGDCKLFATENLKARIAGSGNVYYKGNAVIDAKVSGSGSVQHVN